ncbi:unnamed protein product [Mytilus coruscus]|uniref:Uncharacterized protein n=1 Tax=Mytilus coruscus TaxID=42192 RepID=A0A6J8BM69_MYTCO|nr:unnamed protein product [Mytilus coruscus]
MDQRMEVDAKAMDNYPDDVPDTRALYPCKVSSDGNCLPSCGSVFAHKSEFKASEIRLRIYKECRYENNEHWVPNHFVPILPIDNIIIEDNGRKESKEKEREVKNEEKSEEESKNQENNKGESENLENSNEESENEVNNKEEFENLENSTESENLENNNEESENIENSTESEKVEKGEESAIAENKAEKSENEESKEENEEESENVEKTEEKIKNQREKEIKVENAKQSDKESGKVENANEVGETIGNPSEIESHDCNDTNWKDVPDPSKCVGKYVVIKYDEKPYPGVVQDAGESDIYVQCMHRVGKKDNNCFFWPRTIKDKCWYEFDDVLAVIPEPTKIDGSYSHYKIDQDIWNQITDELK